MNETKSGINPAPVFSNNQQPTADQVEITYFTDPLCCWSWGMEPQWRRLLYEYNGYIVRRYVMGGLLPAWNSFEDTVNNISRPAQMGPLWMQASHISGMPMHNTIWITHPPASSYPACIAVKSAQLQSAPAGERYLRLVRESVMLRGEDISRQHVLVNIAKQLTDEFPGFDVRRFEEDLLNDNGLEAFRADMHSIQVQNIPRFPTFLFRRAGYRTVLLTGYKPYDMLLQAFQQVAVDIPKAPVVSKESYCNFWQSATERELQEAGYL